MLFIIVGLIAGLGAGLGAVVVVVTSMAAFLSCYQYHKRTKSRDLTDMPEKGINNKNYANT